MNKTMPVLADKNVCTGCGTCFAICPKHSIHMAQDKEGFDRPVIDSEACIGCKLCERVCPVLKKTAPTAMAEPTVYAAYTKDPQIRKYSSSGGLFSMLAEHVIQEGGVVCGAALTEGLTVEHILIDTVDDLAMLRGSKYVQSQSWQCFPKISEYLKIGVHVLYSGTPCEVAALLSYLGKPYDNLTTVDIICHGVPSDLVWKRYLQCLKEQNGAEATSASFRDKTDGWKDFSLLVTFKNGSVVRKSMKKDDYMTAFLKNWSLRPSCYHCAFKGVSRASDLTLGDLWGIDRILPDWNDDRGVSVVFVQSERGQQLLSSVSDRIVMQQVDSQQVVQSNSAMVKSVGLPSIRTAFFRRLETKNFHRLIISCWKRHQLRAKLIKAARALKGLFTR